LDGTTTQVTKMMVVSLNGNQAKLFHLGVAGTLTPPTFTISRLIGRNQIIFSGTNGVPDWTYYVDASTNSMLPSAQWQTIATNTFDGSGNFSFTNVIVPGPIEFYHLRLQ
jgi:hypothetical protein